MTKSITLEIFNMGGKTDRELSYKGETLEEIAAQITRDENELMEYMVTGDEKGRKSFVFAGFMFRKDRIEAAQMTEPEY